MYKVGTYTKVSTGGSSTKSKNAEIDDHLTNRHTLHDGISGEFSRRIVTFEASVVGCCRIAIAIPRETLRYQGEEAFLGGNDFHGIFKAGSMVAVVNLKKELLPS